MRPGLRACGARACAGCAGLSAASAALGPRRAAGAAQDRCRSACTRVACATITIRLLAAVSSLLPVQPSCVHYPSVGRSLVSAACVSCSRGGFWFLRVGSWGMGATGAVSPQDSQSRCCTFRGRWATTDPRLRRASRAVPSGLFPGAPSSTRPAPWPAPCANQRWPCTQAPPKGRVAATTVTPVWLRPRRPCPVAPTTALAALRAASPGKDKPGQVEVLARALLNGAERLKNGSALVTTKRAFLVAKTTN